MAKKFNKGGNNRGSAETFNAKGNENQNTALNKWANILYSFKPGSNLLTQACVNNMAKYPSMPTLIKATYTPTIGAFGSGELSPIDLAVSETFAYIRSKNNGKVNFTDANLMIFCMGMKSVITFHSIGIRTLALINMYSKDDWNIPDEFYEAISFDLDDFQKHRTDLSAYLDDFARKANVFSVPNIFPIIRDEAYLCSNIFKLDETNNKGQYLMFEPDGLYRYEENIESGEIFGTLQWEAFPENMTYDQFVEFGNNLIYDMKNSEDHSTMSGDIEKAFPESDLIHLDFVSTDIEASPVYDSLLLEQLHNADVTPLSVVGQIAEDPLYMTISQNLQAAAGSVRTTPHLVDSKEWDPDAYRTADLVRWKTSYELKDSYYQLVANGAQIITSITVYYRNAPYRDFVAIPFIQFMDIPPYAAGAVAAPDGVKKFVEQATIRSYFGNVLPIQYVTNNMDQAKQSLISKINCATILTTKQIQNINRAKFYQFFGVGNLK